MEYVILIIVLAVLAVGTGGWLLFVRPRRGRTLRAPAAPPSAPPAPQATTTPAGSGDGESAAVPETPAAATGVLEVERPPPSAGRLVRLRARLARSQSSLGSALLNLLSRDRLDDDTWDEIEEVLITADVGVVPARLMVDELRTKVKVLGHARARTRCAACSRPNSSPSSARTPTGHCIPRRTTACPRSSSWSA